LKSDLTILQYSVGLNRFIFIIIDVNAN